MRCIICDVTFSFGFGINQETQTGFCPRCDEILSSICEGPDYTLECFELAAAQVEREKVMSGNAGDPFVATAVLDEFKLIQHKQRQRKKASSKESRRKDEKQRKEARKAEMAKNWKFRAQQEAIGREKLRASESYRHKDEFASKHEAISFLKDAVLITPDPTEFEQTDDRDDYTEFYLRVETLKKKGVINRDTSIEDILDVIKEAQLESLNDLGDMVPLPDWGNAPSWELPQEYHVIAI